MKDESMNPKQVWGIIIIILGILSMLYGVNGLHEISMYEDAMASLDRMTSSFLGQNYSSGYGPFAGMIEELVIKSKIRCFLSILSGIAFSILGTMMLKNERVDASAHQKDMLDYDRPFLIQTDQVRKEEDTHWRSPEMREQLRAQRNNSGWKL